jgi:glycosyltransferase 2 family protein
MRRVPWRLLSALAGGVVLAVVLWRVGTGPFVTGLLELDPLTLVLGAVISILATVACAWRWHLVSRELGVRVDLAPGVASCYRAQFLNLTLPGGILGDVHRGVRHGMDAGDTGAGMRAVAWERAAGQAVQAIIALVVLIVLPSPVRGLMPTVLAVLALLVAAVALVVQLTAPSHPDSWAARVRRVVVDDVRAVLAVRHALPGIVLASTFALGCFLATYLLAARAVGVTTSAVALLPVTMLVFLAAGLPINLAGWGPREGMAAWAFGAAGIGAGLGVETAVAYAAIVLVANLPGAVVLVVDGARRLRARPTPEPPDEEPLAAQGRRAHG